MFAYLACLMAASSPPAPVAAVVAAYHAAMEARSVEPLALLFDPDLVVLEGTHQNTGWADYRDHHIGPEMREWSQFKVLESRIIDSVTDGGLGYVVLESKYRITSQGKPVTVAAAETLVLKWTGGG